MVQIQANSVLVRMMPNERKEKTQSTCMHRYVFVTAFISHTFECCDICKNYHA